MRAVISAASSPIINPSLSVDQAWPLRRRKLAPALSSPPKQTVPSNKPGVNHLKPTGTSNNPRPRAATTRLITELDTSVLPIAAVSGHSVRDSNR